MKKLLDKKETMWYNKQAVAQSDALFQKNTWRWVEKKSKEILKNLLTNQKESDIMDRLLRSGERKPQNHVDFEENQEKFKNNFEKPLDKLKKMWYNNKVVWEIKTTKLRKSSLKIEQYRTN